MNGDFAGWLRDAMSARRLSARLVGMRTGINHSTVTRLLQGERQPSLATALALLRLLDSPPEGDELTDGREKDPWPADASLV
ncbi:MAG: helix-turn-helix domain-containing protein [Chloroflexota bacterium]